MPDAPAPKRRRPLKPHYLVIVRPDGSVTIRAIKKQIDAILTAERVCRAGIAARAAVLDDVLDTITTVRAAGPGMCSYEP